MEHLCVQVACTKGGNIFPGTWFPLMIQLIIHISNTRYLKVDFILRKSFGLLIKTHSCLLKSFPYLESFSLSQFFGYVSRP